MGSATKLKVGGTANTSTSSGMNINVGGGSYNGAAGFTGTGQISTSTSGVSSACSGSLLQLSVGGGGSSDVGNVNDSGELSIKGNAEFFFCYNCLIFYT